MSTISQHVELDSSLSRIEEHLNGARVQAAKYRELRIEDRARIDETPPTHRPPSPDEREARTHASIARRRAKNALISELKEALEAAHNLPADPWY